MKIAVIHNLPPGGQKRALYEQVKRLSEKHQLDLFTLSSTNERFLPLKPFIDNHFTVCHYPPPHFPHSVLSLYFKLPQAYEKLADMINEGNYDAAYINPCYLTQTPYILRYLKIPSLYFCPEPKREFYERIPHVSNNFTYCLTYPFRLPIKYIDRTNIKYATRIITNSIYSQKRIKEIYQKEAFVNYLGVETSLFRILTDSQKENMVLTVGEVSLHKGHDFIVRSLSLIPFHNRPKLVIIGHKGIEKNYLLDFARSRQVKMEIVENISDQALAKWYNRAKLFVYAAINEPFGMVLLEAVSCGLPIVAVNEGGIKEILSNELVGSLTKREEKEFSKKIIKYLNAFPNKNRMEKQIDCIKKNWNWEKSVKCLEKHLEETAK
jgi:glycosyltransferase involved in cell wall biosynthesis